VTESETGGDHTLALALLAVDPGLGGVVLRGSPGVERDSCLALLRGLLPFSPWRRLPLHVTPTRLSGGEDLAATIAAGRHVKAPGLLAEVEGGVLIAASAERMQAVTAALLATFMDGSGRTRLVVLDEGHGDEAAPGRLLDRCAFSFTPSVAGSVAPAAITAARQRLASIRPEDDQLNALCGATLLCGIASVRASMLAISAACAHAALAGRERLEADDLAAAGRLVLAWRARCLPAEQVQEQEQEKEAPDEEDKTSDTPTEQGLTDMTVEAVRAALPANLLAQLAKASPSRAMAGQRSETVSRVRSQRGRVAGIRRGKPEGGARLAIVDTLLAAAPWQRVRPRRPDQGFSFRPDDMRVFRTKPHSASTTIFAVDASGSAAMARLAEAKGAVERLLAECYVRRDEVAVVGFRGTQAEILLPPTRSLARAKKSLAGLPGGGGTPLAAGILASAGLAETVRRAGRQPRIVLLTDGRANIGRDGKPGRAAAASDAVQAARRVALAKVPAMLIDTSIRPQAETRSLAASMGARYLELPQADGRLIADAIKALD
jgi:magnesium chelatase subunit D